MKNKYFYILLKLLIIFSLWELLSWSNILGKSVLASPQDIFVKLISFSEPSLYINLYHTLFNILKGWTLSAIIGIPLGLIFSSFKHNDNFSFLDFIRSIPPILVFPLFLIIFNYGDLAYIFTIFFGCFPIFILTLSEKYKGLTPEKERVISSFKIKKRDIFFIRGMELTPYIILSSRIAISIAIIIAVVTEMVFTPNNGYGIGSLARDSQLDFDTITFYSCLVLIGSFGYIVNSCLSKLEKRF